MLVYLIYLGMPQMGYVVNAVPAALRRCRFAMARI